MTATYDYYKLAYPDMGISGGFVYEKVPHITLGAIANDEESKDEYLLDAPIIENDKIRITGPFTVEALPAPVVKSLDNLEENEVNELGNKQSDWRDQLLATGIMGRGGNRLEFSRVEPLTGTKFLQAEAETKEDMPRRTVICFAGETKPLDSRMVAMALDEAENLRPTPQLIIFAAFQFGPEASKDIDDMNWSGVTLLKAQMNTDLMTNDLKKKQSSDQSFWLIGQPEVEIIKDGRTKNKYKVKVNGFDYYDVKKGIVESGNSSRIAMWILDQDYDGLCIEPDQVFFPMGGKKDGWNKLAKTLKEEIDEDLIEKYAGNESLWFMVQPNSQIVVKIVDDRGIESLKVIRIGDEFNNDEVYLSDMELVGEYLLIAKNQGADLAENNTYVVVYSATIVSTDEEFEALTVYFPVVYDGVVRLSGDDYLVMKNQGIGRYSSIPNSWYDIRGYIDGTKMFNKIVTANRESYRYEVSEGLKQFGE